MSARVYPEAFLRECKEILKDEYPAFLAAMDGDALHTLRLNPLRRNAKEQALPFTDAQRPPVLWEPLGRYVLPDARPGRSLAHECGAFYLQDASAMAPVAALNPQPGERVLDLCAAPGGKSGQIAAHMNNEGFLLSNEIDFTRARVLLGNLERLGVSHSFVTSAPSDALAECLEGFFDAVLVDAPCSGEGMFRRDPDAVNEWTPASPAGCATRQQGILDNASRTVRPGGRMVYSTCTFNRAENEETIERFLLAHPDFSPVDFCLDGIGASVNGCLRLWPHRIDGEGHFVACLRRSGEDESAPRFRAPSSKAPAAAQKLLTDTVLNALPEGELILDGDFLRLVPALAPDIRLLKGVRVLRAGLPLGKVGRGFIEPDHALAMALSPESAQRTVSLSDADAAQYLAGEALNVNAENGWTLVLWQSMPLGWGKVSGGILKNHLPKGLRKRGGHTLDA